jgi:deoxyribose-phosphate aldolase
MGTCSGTKRDPRGRAQVHVTGLAARLEHRHHQVGATAHTTRAAARLAVELGLAGLTCRPEHLSVAAAEIGETSRSATEAQKRLTDLTTAVEFYGKRAGLPHPDGIVLEARNLRKQGATDVALVADAERLAPTNSAAFARTLAMLVQDQATLEGRVRVHLDTTGLIHEEIASAAAMFEQAGAWMVQTGTWQGERASFTQAQVMRRAVSPGVLVKWTHPVKTPATMLLCMSAGIDRFNTDDPESLLREAQSCSDGGWLTAPLEGVDY